MKKILCPLCKNASYTTLYPSTLTQADFKPDVIKNNLKNTLDDYRKHAQIVRCDKCKLVYTNPMENLQALLKGYTDVVDDEYLTIEKFRKKLSLQQLELITKFKKKGVLLDVGCFAGFFLELAKEKKWKTFGIEPSKWATSIAKKRDIKILGDNIETIKLKPESFDVVTLWDVIEHLPNPQKTIKTIHKILKKNGIIALGTPNIDSLLAKILKEKYPYLIRMHIILYSPKTLAKLLEGNGFKVLHVSTYGRSYPLDYVLRRIQIKNPVFAYLQSFAKKFFSTVAFYIDLRHEFVMIAQKVK